MSYKNDKDAIIFPTRSGDAAIGAAKEREMLDATGAATIRTKIFTDGDKQTTRLKTRAGNPEFYTEVSEERQEVEGVDIIGYAADENYFLGHKRTYTDGELDSATGEANACLSLLTLSKGGKISCRIGHPDSTDGSDFSYSNNNWYDSRKPQHRQSKEILSWRGMGTCQSRAAFPLEYYPWYVGNPVTPHDTRPFYYTGMYGNPSPVGKTGYMPGDERTVTANYNKLFISSKLFWTAPVEWAGRIILSAAFRFREVGGRIVRYINIISAELDTEGNDSPATDVRRYYYRLDGSVRLWVAKKIHFSTTNTVITTDLYTVEEKLLIQQPPWFNSSGTVAVGLLQQNPAIVGDTPVAEVATFTEEGATYATGKEITTVINQTKFKVYRSEQTIAVDFIGDILTTAKRTITSELTYEHPTNPTTVTRAVLKVALDMDGMDLMQYVCMPTVAPNGIPGVPAWNGEYATLSAVDLRTKAAIVAVSDISTGDGVVPSLPGTHEDKYKVFSRGKLVHEMTYDRSAGMSPAYFSPYHLDLGPAPYYYIIRHAGVAADTQFYFDSWPASPINRRHAETWWGDPASYPDNAGSWLWRLDDVRCFLSHPDLDFVLFCIPGRETTAVYSDKVIDLKNVLKIDGENLCFLTPMVVVRRRERLVK